MGEQTTEFNLHRPHRAVVAQFELFERHVLKPGLVFKGKGSKLVAFKPMGENNRVHNVHRPTVQDCDLRNAQDVAVASLTHLKAKG
jgi:hypothetical protein